MIEGNLISQLQREIHTLREDLQIQQGNVKKVVSRCLALEKELAELKIEHSRVTHQNANLRQAVEMNKHVVAKLRGKDAKSTGE